MILITIIKNSFYRILFTGFIIILIINFQNVNGDSNNIDSSWLKDGNALAYEINLIHSNDGCATYKLDIIIKEKDNNFDYDTTLLLDGYCVPKDFDSKNADKQAWKQLRESQPKESEIREFFKNIDYVFKNKDFFRFYYVANELTKYNFKHNDYEYQPYWATKELDLSTSSYSDNAFSSSITIDDKTGVILEMRLILNKKASNKTENIYESITGFTMHIDFNSYEKFLNQELGVTSKFVDSGKPQHSPVIFDLELPKGYRIQDFDVDRNGNIYAILSDVSSTVYIVKKYDSRGQFVKNIGPEEVYLGHIIVNNEQNILVNTGTSLRKYDPEGILLWETGVGREDLEAVKGLAGGIDGKIYIAYSNGHVRIFDKDFKLINEFVHQELPKNQMQQFYSFVIDSKNNIFFTDCNKLIKYDNKNTLIYTINKTENFEFPCINHVTIDNKDRIILYPGDFPYRIDLLENNGKWIEQLNWSLVMSDRHIRPQKIVVGTDGNYYIMTEGRKWFYTGLVKTTPLSSFEKTVFKDSALFQVYDYKLDNNYAPRYENGIHEVLSTLKSSSAFIDTSIKLEITNANFGKSIIIPKNGIEYNIPIGQKFSPTVDFDHYGRDDILTIKISGLSNDELMSWALYTISKENTINNWFIDAFSSFTETKPTIYLKKLIIIDKFENQHEIPVNIQLPYFDNELTKDQLSGTIISANAPLDMLIINNDNRKTGVFYDERLFKTEVKEIENGFYSGTLDNIEFVYLPDNVKNFVISSSGVKNGDYKIIVASLDDNIEPVTVEGKIGLNDVVTYDVAINSFEILVGNKKYTEWISPKEKEKTLIKTLEDEKKLEEKQLELTIQKRKDFIKSITSSCATISSAIDAYEDRVADLNGETMRQINKNPYITDSQLKDILQSEYFIIIDETRQLHNFIKDCGEDPDPAGIVWANRAKSALGFYDFFEEDLEDISNMASKTRNGGGCLIATATYGSELTPQVQMLRELRDNVLLKTSSGSEFITGFNSFYYSFSPTVADWERQNPAFKETVRVAITPLLSALSLLQYVDIDTEEEMLGYGIGIILLNIIMYFVAPAIIIIKIKSNLRINRV